MSNTFKTLLVGSVATVAFAGVAQAQLDVTVSGRIDFNASYSDDIAATGFADLYFDDTISSADSWSAGGRVDVSAAGSTCCFDYGGTIRVTGGDLRNIYIKSDSWGRLDFGNDASGLQGSHDSDVIGTGVTSTSKSIRGASASLDDTFDGSAVNLGRVAYTSPSFSGVTVAAAIDGDSDWNASLAYSGDFAGASVSAAVGATSADTVAGKVSASFGDWTVGVAAGQDDTDESYTTGGVSYAMGALTLSAAYGMQDSAGVFFGDNHSASQTEILAGAGYTLAPGLTLTGTVGQFERDASEEIFGPPAVNSSLSGTIAEARLRLEF